MMRLATMLLAFLAAAGTGWAQSLLEQTSRGAEAPLGPYDSPKRLPYKKHDHIQVLVGEKTHGAESTQLQTDRRSRFETDINKWIKFNGGKGLPSLGAAQLTGDPGINLEGRFRNDNLGINSKDFDLTFTIMAEVVDIRPNGTLVIQATKRRKLNADEEVIRLTGEVAPQSILGDKVRSDSVVNLCISYDGDGPADDVTKPGALQWVLSKLWPF
jgi:flagellar L-ring protein precursor FlgH